MNPIPNLSFWLQTLGLLAVQTAVVVGLAAGVQIWLKSAAARRAAWQGALLGVALLAVNAFTGADRVLASWARLEPAARQAAVTRGNLPPTLSAPDNAEFPVVRSVRAAATEATAPPTAFWWPAWLWVMGALIVGGRALGSRLLLVWLTRRGGMPCDPETGERIATLADGLGFRRPVRLIESAALVGPIAFGWWRPTIGLPKGFFARHSQAEQDTMLAHELAHLAARDPLWLALADALTAALWWHPAVWWLRRQFRVASETAADDASLLVQDGPVILADCLVSLAAQLQTRRATGWLGMAEFRSGLGRRVERLLRLRPDEAGMLGQKAWWVAPALVAFVLLGLAAAAWAFPNSRSEGPTLFALVQEAMGPEPLQKSDLPRKHIVQLPGTMVHNSIAGLAMSSPAEAAVTPATPAAPTQSAATNRPSKLVTRTIKIAFPWVLDRDKTGSAGNPLLQHLATKGWQPGPGETIFGRSEGDRVFVRVFSTNLPLVAAAIKQLNAHYDPDGLLTGADADVQSVEEIELAEEMVLRYFRIEFAWPRGTNANSTADRTANDVSVGNPLLEYLAARGWRRQPRESFVPATHGPLLEVCIMRTNLPLVEAAIQALNAAAKPATASAHSAPTNLEADQEWLPPTKKPVTPRPQTATNSEAGGQLFSRTYKVDFHALAENMTNATGQGKTNALSTHEALDWYFRAAGWNRATNETFFLNEGSGVLFVRARQASFDVIGSVLQVLTATTPQVLVQVKFIEVSQSDEKALGFDWYLGQVTGTPTNPPLRGVTSGIRGAAPRVFPGGGQTGGSSPRELRGDELDWAGRGATNAGNIRVNVMLDSQMTGILTEAQTRNVLKALEQRSGTDVLSAPSVTTLSGRQAQISVQDMSTFFTGNDPAAGTNTFTTAVIPCGSVLDIVPTVLADGVTVQVNVKASVTEFLGYKPGGTNGDRDSANNSPQPRFGMRELKTIANVWDGQTLILGGGMVELPSASTNAATAGKVVRKQLLVFVTPTVVDPAGNRVHTQDEMPFSTNAVPPQPKPGK